MRGAFLAEISSLQKQLLEKTEENNVLKFMLGEVRQEPQWLLQAKPEVSEGENVSTSRTAKVVPQSSGMQSEHMIHNCLR